MISPTGKRILQRLVIAAFTNAGNRLLRILLLEFPLRDWNFQPYQGIIMSLGTLIQHSKFPQARISILHRILIGGVCKAGTSCPTLGILQLQCCSFLQKVGHLPLHDTWQDPVSPAPQPAAGHHLFPLIYCEVQASSMFLPVMASFTKSAHYHHSKNAD